jgi:hypothetical protein
VSERRWPAAALAVVGLPLFILLATANAAGYRYGVSDQAFHVPAVVHVLTPSAFPRDAALLDVQARFMLFDDLVAAVVRFTGFSLETTFLIGYLASTALLWAGLVLVGRALFASRWSVVMLGAAIAIRHRIPRTTVNSFEPYFYPRTLSFALGVLAIAAVLHRKRSLALALTLAAALAHVTTGFWFLVLVGVACARLDATIRRALWVGVAVVLVATAWAAASGRLAALAAPIDDAWLGVIASNDSLFPSQWPPWAWAANLALPLVLVAIHRVRAHRGTARAEDAALQWGGLALVGLFAISLPFVTWRWTLPTQLQISRVFWLIDFLVIVYAVALVSETALRRRSRRLLPLVASGVVALSVARGAYVMFNEHSERSLFQVRLPPSAWADAMEWLAQQPLDVYVLADPGHVTLYGSSVRVAAQRDVVLEDVKDTAVALYSRDVALRVRERRASLEDFAHLSAVRATALARKYAVDYLVTAGEPLAFPIAYRNATFRIYDLRPARIQ